jgi:hypothetical protein
VLPPDSQRTAYHEARHATIGRVLTLKCGRATIKPNLKEMTAGKAITFDENDCDTAWQLLVMGVACSIWQRDRALGAVIRRRRTQTDRPAFPELSLNLGDGRGQAAAA